MFGLARKHPPLIGLDISSSAVKLLELSQTPQSPDRPYRVESYAAEPLPANAVVDKKIADMEAVAETVKRVVRRSGTKASRAAIAVSGSAVITKVISLPAALSEQEMEAQIGLEADQYIPYALDEVNLDFSVIGPSAKGSGLVDVLLAASRRENVNDRTAVLQLAGLAPALVDVEAYAVGNACEALIPETRRYPSFAVADIGAHATTVYVLDEGRVVYTREQNFGGRHLTEEIEHSYKLSPAEAEAAKRKGRLPEDYEAELLVPFREAVAQQISRALQFFYSASAQKGIEFMVLAGGSANIPRLAEVVAERISAATAVAQPFKSMSAGPRVDTTALLADSPALMVAAGLALRSFDRP